MQTPLEQYKTRISEILHNISTSSTTLPSLAAVDNYLVELCIMRQYIEDTLQEIKSAYTIVLQKKSIKNAIVNSPIISQSLYTSNLTLNYELFPESASNIVNIDKVEDIPIMPIYYIPSIRQYAINIGGMILRGNIGNIYNSTTLKNHPEIAKNLIYCRHKNKCDKLLSGKLCKYYHDPAELLQLKKSGLISATLFREQNRPKNYTNTSWIYTEYPENAANENMRHFGSRDTLRQYIQLAKIGYNPRTKTYSSNYADQCIHDILVMYALYANNLYGEPK